MSWLIMNRLTFLSWIVACTIAAAFAPSLSAAEPKFKVLALAEAGGHHIAFTRAARPWLEKCGQENGFEVDFLTDTSSITAEYLTKYRVVLQLDFVPYGWKPEAQAAFRSYIEQGKGGWVGLHHASLLGDFDGYKMWPWFSDFLGKIESIGTTFQPLSPARSTVRRQNASCMRGVPATFVIPREEWYIYDHSPRSNVRVLASVDESSYSPASTIKMGDHPVIWTNPHVAARNVYIFMGSGPDLLDNKAFTTILRNAIVWAADK